MWDRPASCTRRAAYCASRLETLQLLMLWMARATGIAMCQIAVAVEGRRESAYGYKPTWAGLVEAQPNPPYLHALITPT